MRYSLLRHLALAVHTASVLLATILVTNWGRGAFFFEGGKALCDEVFAPKCILGIFLPPILMVGGCGGGGGGFGLGEEGEGGSHPSLPSTLPPLPHRRAPSLPTPPHPPRLCTPAAPSWPSSEPCSA